MRRPEDPHTTIQQPAPETDVIVVDFGSIPQTSEAGLLTRQPNYDLTDLINNLEGAAGAATIRHLAKVIQLSDRRR